MLSYKTHLLCYIAHDMLFYITDMLCYITDDMLGYVTHVMLCYITHDYAMLYKTYVMMYNTCYVI